MDAKRIAASGSISLTGVGLFVSAGSRLVRGPESLVGTALAAFGGVIAAVIAVGGVWIYRSDLETAHAFRIAGWNLLGVVVVGSVLVLVSLYRPVTLPVFVAATIVGVSAVAHLLIGVNDVRRIRAEALAREREKLAVLNRLVRHNLRSEAQVLLGCVERVGEEAAATIRESATTLGRMNEKIKEIQRAIDRGPEEIERIDLHRIAGEIIDEARNAYPDAEVTMDVPEGLRVVAGGQLEVALAELVENAVTHNDQEVPRARIEADADAEEVEIVVADNGTGIPETERAIVTGEQEITQLEHGSGLGLWMVRWIVEAYDGTVAFEPGDEGGSAVRLRLPRATGSP